jgi:beta-galactosidase/beta-glucuronidase
MERDAWINCNGPWDFALTPLSVEHPEDLPGDAFSRRIRVPFAPEWPLSGIEEPVRPDQRMWYRRSLTLPDEWSGKRVLLNFEAVDWEAACYVNGRPAGEHRGGYIPFSFDITELLESGENEIILSAWDPTDRHWQQRGKQVLKPGGIYYRATSGIWQTVWCEAVSMVNHITGIRVTPELGNETFHFQVSSRQGGERVRIVMDSRKGKELTAEGRSGETILLKVPGALPWEPGRPSLYMFQVELLREGRVIDRVKSYAALRQVRIERGPSGKNRIFLNGKPVFLHGPLDQGYWPDGGMTPPSDEAMMYDIEKTLEMGFNMTRKHIKVEPRRWYYHADRLGLPVIQDMVSGGKNMLTIPETLFVMLTGIHYRDTGPLARCRSGRRSRESREDFERELEEMIDHLYSVPSIIMWVPFNESWGQFDSLRMEEKVRQRDPTRLVDHASGWHDRGGGDFRSRHVYFTRLKAPPQGEDRPSFLSEYGGYNLQVKGHLWDEDRVFGYKRLASKEEFERAWKDLVVDQLLPCIEKGMSAAVYTQLADVEIETNGILTYDRKVARIPAETAKECNRKLYDELARCEQSK